MPDEQPPPPPPWKEPELVPADETWATTQIFTALKQSARKYINFKEPSHYDVLAAWVMGTWTVNKWRAFGPLYLLGDIGSGKTTVLEWLEEVSYHAVRGGSMSTSVMFHLSHSSTPTLLIDETQLYNKDEYSETQALINESYRKGGRVWRMVGEGRNMRPQFFNAYGPRAFAASYPPWPALADRSLTINMESTEEELSETMMPEFYEECKIIRDQLGGYGILNEVRPVPDSVKDSLSFIRNHRVREIGYPLLAASPEHAHSIILGYLKGLEERHRTRKQTGTLADYVKALLELDPEGGKVSARAVREWFIKEWDVSKDKAPSSKTIMDQLETLGFQRTRLTGGPTGIVYDAPHLAKLRMVYCPDAPEQSSLSSLASLTSVKQSEGSEGSEAAGKRIRCEYCDQPFNDHREYEKHRCPVGAGYPE